MDDPVKSDGISARRRLLEEVLEERSKAVATLPILDEEPGGGSFAWDAGIARLMVPPRPGRSLLERRVLARNVAVVALAWMEAIDRELQERLV